MATTHKQDGFGAIEAILVTIVVVLLATGGYVAWNKHANSKPVGGLKSANTAPAREQQPQTTPPDTATYTLIHNTGQESDFTHWKLITTDKINIDGWKIAMTVPEASKGNIVVQADPSDVQFATKGILDDSTCVQKYFSDSTLDPGVSINRYEQGFLARGVINGVNSGTLTLNQYYNTHKAKDGNYFVEAVGPDIPDRHFYKVGDAFYVLYTLNIGAEQREAFARYCPNETYDFYKQFEQMLSTAVVFDR